MLITKSDYFIVLTLSRHFKFQQKHLNKKKNINARNASRPGFESSLVLYLSNKKLTLKLCSRSALPNLYYLGGEGLASFAGLDRVDPDELDEDDDKLETPEDCEAAF